GEDANPRSHALRRLSAPTQSVEGPVPTQSVGTRFGQPQAAIAELLALTDILVDGPYHREHPDTTRRWIGSTNQCIHFLTNRYSFDEQWRRRNTLEIRVAGRDITVNGFPARNAVGLWKGWKRKTASRPASEAP